VNGADALAWADSLEELSVALANVPWPGPWITRGACRTTPTWVFFPTRGDPLDAAKGVCARCAVRQDCADYAVPHADLKGVWGGLSEMERRRIRSGAALPPSPPKPLGPSQSARGSLYRTLQELSGHPGRWAQVVRYASPESASATASLLRRGRSPAPPGVWDFEGHPNDEGGSDLYACLRSAAAEGTDLGAAS
jgi:WhiB family redox-sensing transcriptional regulator